MESLNMSKLNLSSVCNQVPTSSASNTDTAEPVGPLPLDDECYCEYTEDIWQTLLEQEAEKPPIHLQSPQLEFRGALVQQLREIRKKLSLCMATLHSAVAFLDWFMDAHRLRADRLTHVALASLSIAAKSEEKFSRAPTLKTLSKISKVQLCGKTFRQLEWMVGQHVKWRLLSPTAATFASVLSQYIVTDGELVTRHPKFIRKFKKDAAMLLEEYLDLTLSDVRLKVVESVLVGCACIACARAELGLKAWPHWLAERTGRTCVDVASIARLLHRMMQILKARDIDTDIDQGYGSARTSPNLTPCASPKFHVSPASSSCSSSTKSYLNVDTSYRNNPLPQPQENVLEDRNGAYSVLDFNENMPAARMQDFSLPRVEMPCQRVDSSLELKYNRSRRLIEASFGAVEPSTSKAVKRGLEANVNLENKRFRVSQVVL